MLTRRRFLELTALSSVAAVAGGARTVAGANTLEVTRHSFAMPGAGPRLKLALIADVHAPQPAFDFGDVARLANAERPDIVLIVGDSFNRKEDVGLVEMYKPLDATIGMFATAGNWENWTLVRRSTLREHYSRSGIEFLDNESRDFPDVGLHLVGLDERTNGRPDWSVPARSPVDRLTILMHHSPGAFDLLPTWDGDGLLMLSGHTHGGQVAPLGRPLLLPPGSRGYVSGPYGTGHRRLYVTRGIGNSHVPVRIGSRPELAIITIDRTGA